MEHFRNKFYRDEIKKYFFEYIDKKIIEDVKSGKNTDSITEAYKLINSVFSKADKDFSEEKRKENIFAKRGR